MTIAKYLTRFTFIIYVILCTEVLITVTVIYLSFHICITLLKLRAKSSTKHAFYTLYYWVYMFHFMMTASNGNIFRVTGPLCREFTGHRWFPTQRPLARSFDVIFRINGWANNREAGDWRQHCAHCDVTVVTRMQIPEPSSLYIAFIIILIRYNHIV